MNFAKKKTFLKENLGPDDVTVKFFCKKKCYGRLFSNF